MQNDQNELVAFVVNAVKQTLTEGAPVELEGLGTFHLKSGCLRFIPETGPRVFIAYANEDAALAVRLGLSLESAGMKIWMDKRKLLPGQDWRGVIERAIERSDFFIPCFSRTAVRKRGQFPYEVRFAMRCADRMPLDDNFVVPVRLEPCTVPPAIQSRIQYVDLFPDWDSGMERIVRSLLSEYDARRRRDAA